MTPHTSRHAPAIALAAFLCAATVGGCGDGAANFDYTLDGSSPVCNSGTGGPTGLVQPKAASLGPDSNVIRRTQDVFWIVQSGSNTVARYHVETGSFSKDFIDVGPNRNPYDVAVDLGDRRAFIANYVSDSITVANTRTGGRLAEYGSDGLDSPTGIALTDESIYVANIEYGEGEPFGPGHLTVLDRDDGSVVDTRETAAQNPNVVRRIQTPDGPRIAVVDVGPITFGKNGPATVSGDAALELWKPTGSLDDSARSVFPLPLQSNDTNVGAPGEPSLTPDGRYLYFPSATAPVLFKFDLADKKWVRGTKDPIEVYDTDKNSLNHAVIDSRGILYVAAFNEDALYLVDTACDKVLAGPIDLGRSKGLLEGPNSMGIYEKGDDVRVYYNMSLSNTLGFIDATY